MAMAVDNRQQLSGLPYEYSRFQQPQFTDPWNTGTAPNSSYTPALPQVPVSGDVHAAQAMRGPSVSMAYHTGALPAPSMPTGIQPLDPIFQRSGLQAQDYAHVPRSYGPAYPTATTSAGNGYTAPTAAPQYNADYKYAYQDRRSSHPMVVANVYDDIEAQKQRQSSMSDFNSRMHSSSEVERNRFSEALDASRGMVAMSQDITPRNIYGNQGSSRSSSDAYGFPPVAHSAHSSISSASTYPSYYNSSVSEASYGDYSSANESVDVPSRTLPRPNGLIGAQMPPAPQSHMMGQFSSKVSSSNTKKHKCKVCDKRFTRPSSLQTHMYSHTGEKPFMCEVDGCGRQFSVVSNLRRHRKVHKGEADLPSPDDD